MMRHGMSVRMMLVSAVVMGLGLAGQALARGDTQFLVSDLEGGKIVRFDYTSGQVVDHFVAPGISPLSHGHFMVYGPGGDLYVSNANQRSVLRYDGRSGQFIGEFVAPGDGGLDQPRGLAFGPDGLLYVASSANHRVLRYDGATGAFIDEFVPERSGGLESPNDVAFGPRGDLYVVSHSGHRVLRFSGDGGAYLGDALAAGAAGISWPNSVLFDGDGRMYVSGSSSHSIVVVPPDGEPAVLVPTGLGGLHYPDQLAMGPDGTLLVANWGSTGSVLRYDRLTGDFLGALLPGGAGGLGEQRAGLVFMPAPPVVCRADFDGDGELTIFDFLAFQNAFVVGCPE